MVGTSDAGEGTPAPADDAPGAAAAGGSPSPAGSTRRGLDVSVLRRPWVAVPLALVVAFAVWFVAFRDTGSSSSAATPTQTLAAVTKGPIGNVVSAEGTIAADQTANLSFPSSGTVSTVTVKAGDTVTAGQVLATLDSSQLASTVSSAQANVATAQAKLSDDEASGASSAQVAADQTSLQSANDALTNAQQSMAGATLTAPFDGTVALVNVTQGEHLSSSGTGGVSSTGSGTGSGQSASAPSSSTGGLGGGGTGSGTGSSSSSSSAAVQVISKGQYTVTVSVSAGDLGNVQVGQNATVTVSTSSTNNRFGGFGGGFGGFGATGAAGATGGTGATGAAGTSGATGSTGGTGATATGSVTSVSQVASTSSGVAGYPVVVTFNADASSFYVGGTVTAAISTNAKSGVVQVPTRALSTQGGKTVVTVANDGKLDGKTHTVVVSTGETAGGQTEIVSGLQPGQQVVVTFPGAFGAGATGRTGTGGAGGFGGFGGRGGTNGATGSATNSSAGTTSTRSARGTG